MEKAITELEIVVYETICERYRKSNVTGPHVSHIGDMTKRFAVKDREGQKILESLVRQGLVVEIKNTPWTPWAEYRIATPCEIVRWKQNG